MREQQSGQTTGSGPEGNSAEQAAACVAQAFTEYRQRFDDVSRRARQRFEACDWLGMQRDALNRLLLYEHRVERAVATLRAAQPAPELSFGRSAKRAYAAWCADRTDAEIAQTFYNSVMRRYFNVAGALPSIEFVGDVTTGAAPATPAFFTIEVGDDLAAAFGDLLRRLPIAGRMRAPEADARRAAAAIEREVGSAALNGGALDVLDIVFYRNKGAYVVSRAKRSDTSRAKPRDPSVDSAYFPLIFCFINDEDGVRLDAVLPTVDEASIVFSFTRSYFHADVPHPRAAIDFLRSIMPAKRLDELYNSLGFNRHGKTELHRELMAHLERTGAKFEMAPGEAGLVMTVFTLPDLSVVFKLIKDRFGAPKRATRQTVMDKYRYIFTRDRVGRLADAQEFRHLDLPRASFSAAVLDTLRRDAGDTVRIDDTSVVIQHVYTERRVTPFNLYLRDADEPDAVAAMLDYGNAIKELAAANIFPGDMLFKNFGVTRHGRVIFYDYDEVEDLTDCVFRKVPQAPSDMEELAAEPWFPVGDLDVFPEEFERFMVLPGRVGDAFRAVHADLFDVRFWQAMQERLREGEIVDFYPYSPARQLGV